LDAGKQAPDVWAHTYGAAVVSAEGGSSHREKTRRHDKDRALTTIKIAQVDVTAGKCGPF